MYKHSRTQSSIGHHWSLIFFTYIFIFDNTYQCLAITVLLNEYLQYSPFYLLFCITKIDLFTPASILSPSSYPQFCSKLTNPARYLNYAFYTSPPPTCSSFYSHLIETKAWTQLSKAKTLCIIYKHTKSLATVLSTLLIALPSLHSQATFPSNASHQIFKKDCTLHLLPLILSPPSLFYLKLQIPLP